MPVEDQPGPAFELVEEGCIEDDTILDHLGEAAAQLAFRQRVEGFGVDPDAHRLVKGADDVLGPGMVDSDLAAHRAVNLGEQGCGQHQQRDAAGVSRRDEARQVADHSTAECHHDGVPVGPHGDQLVIELGGGLKALARLAGGEHHRMGVDADLLECGPTVWQVVQPGDIPVRDDERRTAGLAGPGRIQRRASKRSAARQVAAGHSNLVSARPEGHGHPDLVTREGFWHAECILRWRLRKQPPIRRFSLTCALPSPEGRAVPRPGFGLRCLLDTRLLRYV